MTPENFRDRILDPSLYIASPLIGITVSDQARVLLMAIAGQESSWTERLQTGAPDLGRSFWQFEQGGCNALATNPTTEPKLAQLLEALEIPYTLPMIHAVVAWNDPLAGGMARLLLYADPHPLPAVGDQDGAWNYYLACWHPGKPRPDDWAANYDAAMTTCGGSRLV